MGNAVTWFEVGAADDRLLTTFYGKLFGWELRPAADGYTMVNTLAGAGINGGIGRSHTGEPWAAFYVEADDPGAVLERAEFLGAAIVVPVTELPGFTFAMFDDPDGLLIGLMKPGATSGMGSAHGDRPRGRLVRGLGLGCRSDAGVLPRALRMAGPWGCGARLRPARHRGGPRHLRGPRRVAGGHEVGDRVCQRG